MTKVLKLLTEDQHNSIQLLSLSLVQTRPQPLVHCYQFQQPIKHSTFHLSAHKVTSFFLVK